MAGRIRIPPYKPLGSSTQAVPGGGYFDIDAGAGQFGASPLLQLGLEAAQGAVGIVGAVSPNLGSDNEAAVKAADTKLGETEQALLFDPTTGYLNLQGQAALQRAPAVLDAYNEAQARTLDTAADDDQRRMLQELADKRLASFNEVVERHSTAQRQSWYDQVGDQRIAAMNADAALHWSSDALLRRALGTARAEVRERAERKGWDSPLTEAALSRETSRVLVSAIGAAVDRDPERARSLRTRYAAVIENTDRAALDALLAEAQTRERAYAASAEILNAPPEGHDPTPQWRVEQADAITDPAVRAATIRRLNSAAAAAEARAHALGEQVLARVLKNGLTDPSQIPVSEWVALDAARRQAIATRLDHNAAGTEPAPNPAQVDDLATQMTQVPYDFARRDLVAVIAHLPLRQWQRFHDWQAGLLRNDPTTEGDVYAIRRGLQLTVRILPVVAIDGEATTIRAGLVEDIDAQRRITGTNPDDGDIRAIVLRRSSPATLHAIRFATNPNVDLPIDDRSSDDPSPDHSIHQANLLKFLLEILIKRRPPPVPRPVPAPTPQPNPRSPSPRMQRPPPQPWGRGYGANWSPVAPGRPPINKGQQAKHDPAHPYFRQNPSRSPFTHSDPQALINKFAGTGQPANTIPRGQPDFRERVDFGEIIGRYQGVPTRFGTIRYAKDGSVHIVPARPWAKETIDE